MHSCWASGSPWRPMCSARQSAINGEITGTVTDPSGAAISGATVQVTNIDNGFKQSTKTGDTGLYRFTVLPLGTYDVEVQASGFGTTRRTGIALTVGATATDGHFGECGRHHDDGGCVGVGGDYRTQPHRSGQYAERKHDAQSAAGFAQSVQLHSVSAQRERPRQYGIRRAAQDQRQRLQRPHQLSARRQQQHRERPRGHPPDPDFRYLRAEVQQVSNGFAPEFGNTVGTVFNTITKSGANEFPRRRRLPVPPHRFQRAPQAAFLYGPGARGQRGFLFGGWRRTHHQGQALLLRRLRTREARPAGRGYGERGKHRGAGTAGQLRQPDSLPPERLLLYGQGRLAAQRQESPLRALHAPRQRFALQQQRHRRHQPGLAILQLRRPFARGRGAVGLDCQRPHRQRTARSGGLPRPACRIASPPPARVR